jgi:hypothetical protein
MGGVGLHKPTCQKNVVCIAYKHANISSKTNIKMFFDTAHIAKTNVRNVFICPKKIK